MAKIVVVFLILMAVGVGSIFLVWNKFFLSSGESTGVTPLPKNPQVTLPSTPIRLGKNAIVVFDQVPADFVLVSAVAIEKPGFIGVHKATDDNLPGRLIGNSELIEGYKENLRVGVSSSTSQGDKLIAVLYQDNGDKVFDTQTDDRIEDKIGNPLAMVFNISSAADITLPQGTY